MNQLYADIIKSVSVRLATPDDAHIQTFDNTKLTNTNTCPTWGVIRYGLHKTFAGGGRAMALEAGSACHEAFAAVRLFQLFHHQGLIKHYEYHGQRIFGADGFKQIHERISGKEDERTNLINTALQALEGSGFYDDPYDKRRTVTNLEECLIAYCDRWQMGKHPIWIEDYDDPTAMVGIEIPFDLVVDFEYHSNEVSNLVVRFTGKIDGIHIHDTKIVPHENKTTARLDDAFLLSFQMLHQITGYCLATATITQTTIDKAILHGLAIPLPRTYDYGGIITEMVSRKPFMFIKWFEWFYDTIQVFNKFLPHPDDAPRYTHSCNRYYRPCSFLPYCTTEDREEREQILDEMVIEEWSPLDDKARD